MNKVKIRENTKIMVIEEYANQENLSIEEILKKANTYGYKDKIVFHDLCVFQK